MKERIVRLVCLIIMFICLIWLVVYNKRLKDESNRYVDLRDSVSQDIEVNRSNISIRDRLDIDNREQEEISEPVIMDKFQSLYKKNNDLVGWITNEDKIDYPIMQCQEDSNFYLHKGFDKKDSESGSIYIPNDITIEDKMVMIYGHHMKNNTMFGSLEKYLDKGYFKDNKEITLSTLYEDKKYEVVAAFVSKVYDDNYKGFKYYDYRGNITEEEFDEYKKGIKSLVRVGNIDNLCYNDNIIELITCWYSEKDARLVLLCKQVN